MDCDAKFVCRDTILIPIREITHPFSIRQWPLGKARCTHYKDSPSKPSLTQLPCLSSSWRAKSAGLYRQRITVKFRPLSSRRISTFDIVSIDRWTTIFLWCCPADCYVVMATVRHLRFTRRVRFVCVTHTYQVRLDTISANTNGLKVIFRWSWVSQLLNLLILRAELELGQQFRPSWVGPWVSVTDLVVSASFWIVNVMSYRSQF